MDVHNVIPVADERTLSVLYKVLEGDGLTVTGVGIQPIVLLLLRALGHVIYTLWYRHEIHPVFRVGYGHGFSIPVFRVLLEE